MGILLFLLPVIVLVLLMRQQQRRLRQHQALVASIEVGDEVVTTSGIFGTITSLDDETAQLERFRRSAEQHQVVLRRVRAENLWCDGNDVAGQRGRGPSAGDLSGEQVLWLDAPPWPAVAPPLWPPLTFDTPSADAV